MAPMSNATEHDLPPFMTASRAGRFLGYQDGSFITRLCKAGKIPGAYKDGRPWYVPREWVLQKKGEEEKAGIVRNGTRGRRITTGAGKQRKDRGGPGGNPYHTPTGRPRGRPKKQEN